jgi:hypothetical protein
MAGFPSAGTEFQVNHLRLSRERLSNFHHSWDSIRQILPKPRTTSRCRLQIYPAPAANAKEISQKTCLGNEP